ncbi:rhomboid family intramembrane serine protease [Tianweitania sediminis]|uniref:Rhomboid family intramembrane serine protease n=1 Tax=Tianweitania sediminis TaxID=1502156 RepID=A0A8J7UHK0_9HYPH|nr:rhomboid family intramembrane serine protease [Tianweitania sediminis]MBP0437898.1 rhomboid family intramembrane serine protease [Tianweitania sediminis]
MFIPLHDANTLKRIKLQYVTLGIIGFNIAVYLFGFFGGVAREEVAILGFGLIPSTISGIAERPDFMVIVPDLATFATYGFLHGGLLHLGGNMLFLWVFGDNVEDAMGHARFVLFYLACSVAGGAVHFLVAPDSQVPLIGASGAIAGVVAAYLVLHPRVKIWILAFGRIPLRLPAWIALALWIVFQIGMFLFFPEDQVSWAAHVGGILCGGVLVFLLRLPEIPLMDSTIVTPRAVVTDAQVRSVPRVRRRVSP